MKEQFVSYSLAKVLHYNKGFAEECLATIDQTEYLHINGTKDPGIRGAMVYDTIPCLLWQQVTKWLRDKHNLHIEIGTTLGDEYKTQWIMYWIEGINGEVAIYDKIGERFNTYEEVMEAGINEALKLI